MMPNQEEISAAAKWQRMVDDEHAQSETIQSQHKALPDSWEPFAERFRPDLNIEDPLAQRLLREISLDHTVLDVGAGAGRISLPISMQCRSIVAVEPSASMRSILKEEAERINAHNIVLVPCRWEDASVVPTDIVLCIQVLHTVSDIVPFVRKLQKNALKKVFVVLHENPPYTQANPLWPEVHGQPRLKLPSIMEFIQVLWEIGIYPDLEMLSPQEPRGFASPDSALQQMRPRLLVEPASKAEKRLQNVLEYMLYEDDGRFKIKGASTARPGLISWRPE